MKLLQTESKLDTKLVESPQTESKLDTKLLCVQKGAKTKKLNSYIEQTVYTPLSFLEK